MSKKAQISQHPQAEVSLVPDTLPDGWASASLGAGLIVDLQPGFASGEHSRNTSGVAHLRPMNVNTDGQIDLTDVKYVAHALAAEKDKWLQRGDVLFNNTNSPELVGKTAYYDKDESLAFSNHMTRVEVRADALDPRYLASFLHANWRSGDFKSRCNQHVSQASIGREALLATRLPIPPLPEQRRIAEKLDRVGERVAAAREQLTALRLQLDFLRNAVIAAACSGQLSTEWRTYQPTTEDAVTLLSQIARERLANTGKRRGRELSPEDITQADAESASWDIPPSWTWCRLADLLHYQRSAAYGVLQPGNDVDSGIPFVRIGDLAHGTVQADALKRIAPSIDARFPRTRLHGGEVLVSLVGTIGRTAVAPPSLKGANVARAIGVFPLCPHVQPDWVRIALDHPSKSRELVNLSREVARKTLNLGLLKAVKIPLPPKSEQVAIVRIATDLLSLIRKAELRAAAAAARTESLSDSTARAAFRGALVPTQAELARTTGVAFESGDAILDRIRRQPVPRKAREQSSEEKPMVKSKDTPRDVLQRAVDAMPQQRFSFEDLRAKVTDDYDAVRDALFELLDTPHSGVKQVFDAKTKTLMLERVSK